MKNEMNKISKWKILLIWLGAIVVISGITGIIVAGLGTEGKITGIVIQNSRNLNDHGNKWAGWPIAASMFAVLFTKAVFLLFEAFLISSLLIDEFKNRTINQLFSYPIGKMKILWSKNTIIILLSIIAQYAAHLVIQLTIKWLSLMTGNYYELTVAFFMNLLSITLGTVLIGLLPFVFGMSRYSTVVTMLSSLAVAAVISNALPGTLEKNLMNSIPFLVVTSVISIFLVFGSTCNIVKKDVSIH
jgi:ABC-type transport system involved in multi-copper enzyme maturation permease subunit